MLFLKKHAWWLVSIVVGLGISALILSRNDAPPVTEDELVPSGADVRSARSVPSASIPPYVAEGIEGLKAALKYHPESPALHVSIAEMLFNIIRDRGSSSPEEVVAFAKKALRLLQNSTENPDVYGGVFSRVEQAHYTWRASICTSS